MVGFHEEGKYPAPQKDYYCGLGGSAITPFGPVSVYFAIPFNNDPFDRTKRFEFTVGNKF